MVFQLYGCQRVILRCDKITFCHKRFHYITLNRRQFDNLHDILNEMDNIKLKSYPLGSHLWLYRHHDSFCLTSHYAYFLFHYKSWQRYKRHVHHRIRHILRDDRYKRATRDQYDADDEGEYAPQPRRPTSQTRRQTVSRPPRDVITAPQQWTKRTTISSRNDTNTRSNPPARGREDAMRDSQTTSSPLRDSYDDIEYGNFNSDEEPVLTENCEE